MDDHFFRPFGSGSRQPAWGGFTDPFELFDSIFRNMHQEFDDPVFARAVPRSRSMGFPFSDMGPFGQSMVSSSRPFGSPFAGTPFEAMFPPFLDSSNPNVRSYSSTTVSHGVPSQGQWMSQSTSTRTINGRTENIRKWRGSDVS